MQTQALARTSLLIAIPAVLGFLAGQHFSSPPSSVPPTELTSSRPIAAIQTEQKSLVERSRHPEVTSDASILPVLLSQDLEQKLSSLLTALGKRDFQMAGDDIVAWFAAHPDEAAAYLSASAQRDGLFSQMFALWGKKDPHAASLWLAEHPNAPGRDSMAAGLAKGVAREYAAASMKWVAAIKDPLLKLNAGREAGWVVYRMSEEDAEAGLREAGIPESAIPALKAGWQKQFSTTTTRNSQNLVSIANAAAAAGATINSTNVEDLVSRISTGVNGGGQFKGSIFMVDTSDWTNRELSAARKLIRVNDGSVHFEPQGGTDGP